MFLDGTILSQRIKFSSINNDYILQMNDNADVIDVAPGILGRYSYSFERY